VRGNLSRGHLGGCSSILTQRVHRKYLANFWRLCRRKTGVHGIKDILSLGSGWKPVMRKELARKFSFLRNKCRAENCTGRARTRHIHPLNI
jgi:hypothetical protein